MPAVLQRCNRGRPSGAMERSLCELWGIGDRQEVKGERIEAQDWK